jgi:peptide/nickel transport system substrate-binding protein
MKRLFHLGYLFLMAPVLVVALLAAQCTAAPTEPPPATPVAEQSTKPATDAAPPAQAMSEATAAADKQVQESEAAQSKLQTGATFVTDEADVSAPRTKQGGTYRDVSTSDAVSFHPYQTTDTGSSAYQGMVYSGSLLNIDEKTLDYEPYVAESYSISEDGLTFTFKLRQGLKWSDGKPITAQDYKWTYDQVMKPENEYPYLDQFDFITSYQVLDDYTLEIKIDKMYCPALSQIDFITPLPKHVWEKLDWTDPEKNSEINNPSVYSGPYQLKEWKRDQYVTFEANDNYWYHGPPNMTGYNIEIVPDQDVAYEKMKNGESDTGTITPENLEEARQLPNLNVYEWWPAAAVWSYVGLNLREGSPTHDINVRHGISYALDKDTMTEEIMVGQAKRQCSAYPETSWAYNPDVPCYDYDVDQAKEAFAQAGYTVKDGKMVDQAGNPLKLKLIYGPNTSQVRELIAVSVQDYLKEIGIEVDVQGLEWASFLEATESANPDWDMFIGAWRSTIEPNNMFAIWSEESIPQLNAVAYINKKVEKLFEEAGGGAGTCDLEFRKQKYQEIQKILADESPYVFLWYQKVWSGQNKRIQGIEPTLLGIGWNQEDWYIKDAGN